MSDSIVLTVPEDLAARAKRIAEKTSQPVEKVLLDHLCTLSAPLPKLPSDECAELLNWHVVEITTHELRDEQSSALKLNDIELFLEQC